MSKADPSRSGSLVTKVHPVLSSYWAELEDRPYPPILPPPGGLPIHDLTGRITSQTVDLGTEGQVGRGRKGAQPLPNASRALLLRLMAFLKPQVPPLWVCGWLTRAWPETCWLMPA